MAICEVCGTDYPSKRADSKCCGPTCRSRARRATDNNATLNPPADATLNSVDASAALPGDPAYDGVALQEKFRPNWAHPEGVDFRPDDIPTVPDIPRVLPDCVPDIIRYRYNREGDGYRATVDRLVSTSIADLLIAGVSVPVWRYNAPLPV